MLRMNPLVYWQTSATTNQYGYQNLRVKSVYELSILGPFLHETELEGDHDIHEAGKHSFLLRADHLAINL